MTTSSPTPVRSAGVARTSVANAALAVVVGIVGGSIAATIIQLIGKALGAPKDARQLQPGTYVALVVIGVLFGGIGWYLISNRAQHPRPLLSRLVPVVLVLSFIPDLLLGIGGAATWGAVVTLMVMHLGVAAAAVPSYLRFMPPQD